MGDWQPPDHARHVVTIDGETYWANEWRKVDDRDGPFYSCDIVCGRWDGYLDVFVHAGRVTLYQDDDDTCEFVSRIDLTPGWLSVLLALWAEIEEKQAELRRAQEDRP